MGICLLLISCNTCDRPDNRQLLNQLQQLEWGRISDTTAYRPFIQSDDAHVRAELCLSIGKIQSPELFTILSRMTRDLNLQVIRNAVFALGQMHDDQSTGLLIALYQSDAYRDFKLDIIRAIGKSENKLAYDFLIKNIGSMQDSVLTATVHGISYLTKEETRKQSAQVIKPYLESSSADIRNSAVYYFARHPEPSLLAALIRSDIKNDHTAIKYRLRAIDKSMNTASVSTIDSSLLDSLRQEVTAALVQKDYPWQTRIYQIGILGTFNDSISVATIAAQLQDSIFHIRSAAIHSLGRQDNELARMFLLSYYNQAGWGEKGSIIYSVSRYERNLAYRLIQQNLNQGTIYFKQLLLRSLARIGDQVSLSQLRQFLKVPTVRLQQTAFMELNERGLISYQEVQPFLKSGDMVLIWLASEWIGNHPNKADLNDLMEAYHGLNEKEDHETMSALLSAISALKNRSAIPFLTSALDSTRRSDIKDQIVRILTAFDVTIEALPQTQKGLFIPPDIINRNRSAKVTVTTERGDIILKLHSDVAPLTVSNFIYLINKGFYNNITFHRVVSDFVIQAGDPRGDGWGGPGYSIPCEYNLLPFKRGTLGLATGGKDTGGSQFFICHSEQPHLDRRYTVFGEVVHGMDVVDNIDIDDKIVHITITN